MLWEWHQNHLTPDFLPLSINAIPAKNFMIRRFFRCVTNDQLFRKWWLRWVAWNFSRYGNCLNALLLVPLCHRLPAAIKTEILLRITGFNLWRAINGRFCKLELRKNLPDFSWKSLLITERQTRKQICGQGASSHDCSSNSILSYCIFTVFKFSCGLTLELFSEGSSLPFPKLLVNFLDNLEKIVKRDGIVYLHFLDNKVLQLVKLIIKSKAVEATFFAVSDRALFF